MRRSSRLVAIMAAFSSTLAAFQGFNYGSTFNSGAPKFQLDFEAEFKAARSLIGAPGAGFTSARLYTTVQAGTSHDPISAIPAAISTKTSILLGVWCSAGDAVVSNEIQALKTAINKYGADLASLVAGISVGSEDLYRNSPTGILNKENPGKNPSDIALYIKQIRSAIAGTPLAEAPVGHVDTWTAWVNDSNQAVIEASDWIGVDAYPYFQETQVNTIGNSKALFDAAFDATKAAVGGKPVWVTETGYPVSGKAVGLAVPGLENAKTYWDQVGCPMFGVTNVWWYTFQDAAPATPNPSFGLIGSSLTTSPLYDISCKNVNNPHTNPSSNSPAPTSSPTVGASGGSPGGASGLGSSQASSESASVFNTAGKPTATIAVGPGSGTNTTTNPTTDPNGVAATSGSISAVIAAVMVAILAL